MMREKQALSILIVHTHLNTNKEHDRTTFKILSELIEDATKRSTDLVCRFHNNEIAIGLFSLDEEGTATVADRILHDCVEQIKQLGENVNLAIGALNVVPSNEIELNDVFDVVESLTAKAEHKGKNSYEIDYYRMH